MKIESLHIGMKVRHPQLGMGVVKAIQERTAEVRFDDGVKTVDPALAGLTEAEPQSEISGLHMPLTQLLEQAAEAVIERMGVENPQATVPLLGNRWIKGRLVLHPSDPTLQTKEVPVEVFFHKIVMIRNQLRVLEQKVNAHPTLTDEEKVDLQQYITRCYGSMTTFNLLFRNKEDQFGGAAA